MEGEQLPKATMNTFLKSQTPSPYSAEFLSKILYISKEFISRVADKSNLICESVQKKTISTEHLETALIQFGVTSYLRDLKDIESNIKEHNQLKRQATIRLEEMLAKDLEEQRERRKLETTFKKQVTIREKFDQIERQENNEGDFDYEGLAENEVEIISNQN